MAPHSCSQQTTIYQPLSTALPSLLELNMRITNVSKPLKMRRAALGTGMAVVASLATSMGPFSLAMSCHAKTTSPIVSTGLKNLGNTCYMNAQLQCAFHIPAVRDIVLSSATPPAVDPPEPSTEEPSSQDDQQDKQFAPTEAALAAKELFEGMIKSAEIESTAYMPRSFCARLGIPPMVQQDSQEFWKLLLPAIGSEDLSDLYKGVYVDYLSSLDGSGRERSRDEIFLDLSLDISKCSDLITSLIQEFGEPELLSVSEGNGWRPEKGADKVDAHKGSSLVAKGLPPILQFHLKRFNYDWETDRTTKLNKRFEFPNDLDLSSVCSDVGETEKDLVQYDLQSVVVHVGEYSAGHYYSYVRPDMNSDSWYRFNDDIVEKVPFQAVMDDVFGGRAKRSPSATKGTSKSLLRRLGKLIGRRNSALYGWGGESSNAYVVQYVRRKDVSALYEHQA